MKLIFKHNMSLFENEFSLLTQIFFYLFLPSTLFIEYWNDVAVL